MVRIKHRYLLVNILYPDAVPFTAGKAVPDLVQFHRPTPDYITAPLLLRAVREEVGHQFGDYGSGVTGGSLSGEDYLPSPFNFFSLVADLTLSSVKYFSNATSTFILRCPRAHYRIVWAALSFMTQLPSVKGVQKRQDCVMRVVRVSGTIKKAENELVRRARADILRVRREGGEDVRSAALLEGIFGVGKEQLDGGIGDDDDEEDEMDEDEDDG